MLIRIQLSFANVNINSDQTFFIRICVVLAFISLVHTDNISLFKELIRAMGAPSCGWATRIHLEKVFMIYIFFDEKRWIKSVADLGSQFFLDILDSTKEG